MRIHFIFRLFLGGLMFLGLALFMLYSADTWIDRHAKTAAVEVGLDAYNGNSVKHAFAAGELFLFLKSLGFETKTARTLVFKLGALNEWMEYYTALPQTRDYTAEIMKDLLNNLYGVEIAAWWKETAPDSSWDAHLKIIAKLTKQEVLPLSYRDNRIPYAEVKEGGIYSDPNVAIAWFYEQEDALSASVIEELKKVRE